MSGNSVARICVLMFLASAATANAAGLSLSSATIKPNSTLSQDQVFNGFG